MGIPEPLDHVDRASPHQRIPAHEAFLEAQKLCQANRRQDALPVLQKLYDENPYNHNTSFLLGTTLISLGRAGDAIRPLQDAIDSRGEDWIGGPIYLGLAYETVGQPDLAIKFYERSLSRVLGPPGFMERLIRLLRAAGEDEKAEQYEKRLAEARH